jgi:hypothetical protein
MGSACVNCGSSIKLDEFEISSVKQFEKQEFAFHLDVDNQAHQKLIKKFQ